MTTTTRKTSVVERFLRYVTVDTQSSEHSETTPTTAKQLVLLDQLVDELKAIGVHDAARGDGGIVFATIPATTKKRNVPVIGLLAHVDTSPEQSGAGVRPIVHASWDGRDITLPDDPAIVLRPSELPELRARIGDDIITASGKTLLGADDKSGVAAIMAAAEHLIAHPEIPHGAIRIAFTPDEEVGRGTARFDVARFGAVCAYTLDAGPLGELDAETFSADSITVTFQGFNAHPGFAKDRMVNAIKAVSDLIGRLPKDAWSPERTEGREGFVHPYILEGGVDRASVKFLVRDFSTAALAGYEARIEALARATAADWPGTTVTCRVEESYRNMKEVLDRHPEIVENAREAMRRADVPVIESAIRGGTDGSMLSYMGLPTPNLFAGQHNFHSRMEWVSTYELEKAVEVVVQLVQVWEERAS